MSAQILKLDVHLKPPTTDPISFWVPGSPVGKGDHTPFRRQDGSLGVRDARGKRGADWRSDVRCAAEEALKGRGAFSGAVRVDVVILVPHPQKHFFVGKRAGELRPNAPTYPTSATDVDKVLRSIGDALNGVLWVDDKFITQWRACRRWGKRTGVMITASAEPLP